jgi:hypothetical protein
MFPSCSQLLIYAGSSTFSGLTLRHVRLAEHLATHDFSQSCFQAGSALILHGIVRRKELRTSKPDKNT